MLALEEMNWDWSRAELPDAPKTKHGKLLQFQVALASVPISYKTRKGTRLLKWIYQHCIHPLVELLLLKPLRWILAKILILVPVFIICGLPIWVRLWLPLCPYITMANQWVWETLTTILGSSLEAWWILTFGSSKDTSWTLQTLPSSYVERIVVSITQILTPFSSLIRTVMLATSTSSVVSPSNTFGKDLIPISAMSFQPKRNRPTIPDSISACSTKSTPAPTMTISIASSLMFELRQAIIVTFMWLLCVGGGHWRGHCISKISLTSEDR